MFSASFGGGGGGLWSGGGGGGLGWFGGGEWLGGFGGRTGAESRFLVVVWVVELRKVASFDCVFVEGGGSCFYVCFFLGVLGGGGWIRRDWIRVMMV